MKKKDIVVEPMVFPYLNSRCQVDLQCQLDVNYGFVFYFSFPGSFEEVVTLMFLQTRRAEEVSKYLLDIFLFYGAPCMQQYHNGREFSNKLIEDL
ncbi:hypothetical protein TNCT_534111 [Trichonephila clavata]|uniref:KRAB-A domain-containing protein 2 n=1 Tax=Trichonephila clavata TaxID=2740835 RepID=A0A8X6H811_TRICU|nr:hypothetical protein TNCT_534111 [Trichonephila clavata]